MRRRVSEHREWFLGAVTDLLFRVGEGPADNAGRLFVMMRDGAMAAGCLADPEAVSATFLDGVEGLLWSRSVPGSPGPEPRSTAAQRQPLRTGDHGLETVGDSPRLLAQLPPATPTAFLMLLYFAAKSTSTAV